VHIYYYCNEYKCKWLCRFLIVPVGIVKKQISATSFGNIITIQLQNIMLNKYKKCVKWQDALLFKSISNTFFWYRKIEATQSCKSFLLFGLFIFGRNILGREVFKTYRTNIKHYNVNVVKLFKNQTFISLFSYNCVSIDMHLSSHSLISIQKNEDHYCINLTRMSTFLCVKCWHLSEKFLLFNDIISINIKNIFIARNKHVLFLRSKAKYLNNYIVMSTQ
jgi:hypothetical protein